MMHRRRWVISPIASIEELARMLTQSMYTLCSGFYVEGHPETAFLNDATHEDGAGEYAVLRSLGGSDWTQVESITFSWTDEPTAAAHIRAALAGEYDSNDFARKIDLQGRLDTPDEHRQRNCHLCA